MPSTRVYISGHSLAPGGVPGQLGGPARRTGDVTPPGQTLRQCGAGGGGQILIFRIPCWHHWKMNFTESLRRPRVGLGLIVLRG